MGFISPYYVYWINENVLTLRAVPEVWRLVTPFILTGPKLGMIFDPYFLYTYGSALETGAPRFSGPGDFLVYIFFLCVVILVSSFSSSIVGTNHPPPPHKHFTYLA